MNSIPGSSVSPEIPRPHACGEAPPGPPAKIIITGTGRAGTTFLVQLLTELHLDTGYPPGDWTRDYDEHCAAGLEHDACGAASPRIIKNPAFCETLPGLLAQRRIAVEHAIVPLRALDEAARSRIAVGGTGGTPGGLWGTDRADEQKQVLAANFHQLIQTLVAHNIPITFLDFPRFARDAAYTRDQLRWLVGDIEPALFSAAFARVARPELIHDFSRGVPPEAGAPARAYARKQQRRRGRRLLRRLLQWSAAAGVGAALVSLLQQAGS